MFLLPSFCPGGQSGQNCVEFLGHLHFIHFTGDTYPDPEMWGLLDMQNIFPLSFFLFDELSACTCSLQCF